MKLSPSDITFDAYSYLHYDHSGAANTFKQSNENASQTLASMDKVEQLLKEAGATLWIEHDKDLADTLRKAPAFYD